MRAAVKTQRGQFTCRSISSESLAVNRPSDCPVGYRDYDYAARTARPTILAGCCWICRTRNVCRSRFGVRQNRPVLSCSPDVLAVRLAIYRGLKKWELMQQIAKRLKEFEPDNVQWTISLAYAMRRAYSIDVAMEILLNAAAKFPKEAAISYNLACYYCQRGEIENAKRYLRQAFEIDPNWRKAALEDEDLKPLWDSL